MSLMGSEWCRPYLPTPTHVLRPLLELFSARQDWPGPETVESIGHGLPSTLPPCSPTLTAPFLPTPTPPGETALIGSSYYPPLPSIQSWPKVGQPHERNNIALREGGRILRLGYTIGGERGG